MITKNYDTLRTAFVEICRQTDRVKYARQTVPGARSKARTREPIEGVCGEVFVGPVGRGEGDLLYIERI